MANADGQTIGRVTDRRSVEDQREHDRRSHPGRGQANHLVEKQQHQRAERDRFNAERDRSQYIEQLDTDSDPRRPCWLNFLRFHPILAQPCTR